MGCGDRSFFFIQHARACVEITKISLFLPHPLTEMIKARSSLFLITSIPLTLSDMFPLASLNTIYHTKAELLRVFLSFSSPSSPSSPHSAPLYKTFFPHLLLLLPEIPLVRAVSPILPLQPRDSAVHHHPPSQWTSHSLYPKPSYVYSHPQVTYGTLHCTHYDDAPPKLVKCSAIDNVTSEICYSKKIIE
jgi:hypothetical protein